VNCLTKGWKLGSIDSLLKRICKSRFRHEAVENLLLGQKDKPKRHRSACEISHETAILHSNVHRIIHRDLQLKCFKRRPTQLISEANRIFHHNLTVCNKSCYCSIINRKLNNK